MSFDEGTLFLQATCNHRGGSLKFAGVAQLVVRQPADPKLRSTVRPPAELVRPPADRGSESRFPLRSSGCRMFLLWLFYWLES